VGAAVLLICFNREDFVQESLKRIVEAGPSAIYVHVDGPRDSSDSRAQKEIRAVVESFSHLATPLHFRQLPKNLGCGAAVNAAIDWVFETEPEAIILEDDLLPNPDFFRFVNQGLEKFERDPTVGQIAGYNPIPILTALRGKGHSAIVSHKPYIWGWGTWADRWQSYRNPRDAVDTLTSEKNLHNVRTKIARVYREISKGHQAVLAGKLDTWDYSWAFAFFQRGWVCVLPPRNLIKNIGFDERSTHTTAGSSQEARSLPRGFAFPPKIKPGNFHEQLVILVNVWGKARKNFRKDSKVFLLALLAAIGRPLRRFRNATANEKVHKP
jgi:glycosyltransferase involved in cell wall biosynthesis